MGVSKAELTERVLIHDDMNGDMPGVGAETATTDAGSDGIFIL